MADLAHADVGGTSATGAWDGGIPERRRDRDGASGAICVCLAPCPYHCCCGVQGTHLHNYINMRIWASCKTWQPQAVSPIKHKIMQLARAELTLRDSLQSANDVQGMHEMSMPEAGLAHHCNCYSDVQCTKCTTKLLSPFSRIFYLEIFKLPSKPVNWLFAEMQVPGIMSGKLLVLTCAP